MTDTPTTQPTGPDALTASATARTQGYSWDEIQDHLGGKVQAARQAGYSDDEIKQYLGYGPDSTEPSGSNMPTPGDKVHQWAQSIRPVDATQAIQLSGNKFTDLNRIAGYTISSVGRIFGAGMVDALGDALDMADGRPRTPEEMNRLASSVAMTMTMFHGTPEAGGMRPGLPAEREIIDAGSVLAKQAGDTSPQSLNDWMKAAGHNYTATGEQPLAAAIRAQADPAVAQTMKQRLQSGAAPQPMEAAAAEVKPVQTPSQTIPLTAVAKPNTLMAMLKDESGAVQMAPLPGGPVTPETIMQRGTSDAKTWGKSIAEDAQRFIDPGSLAPETAGVLREAMAGTDVAFQQSADQLRRYGRAIGGMSSAERLQFLDAYETGNVRGSMYTGTPLGDLATKIHDMFDDRWNEMDRLGIAPNYIQNYMSHEWADPAGIQAVMQKQFGGNRIAGDKSFLRERSFDTIKDGIASGLKLATDDPVEMALTRLKNMDKAISEKKALDNLVTLNQVHNVTTGGPPRSDLVRLNTRDIDQYYAPPEVARLWNTYASEGLSRSPIYQAVRSMSNNAVGMQLLGPGYHAITITTESVISQMALAAKQLSRLDSGEAFQAIKTAATAPFAPAKQLALGRQVIQQLLGTKQFGPEVQSLADALIAGGGRVRQSEEYRFSAMGSFWHSIEGSLNPQGGQMALSQDIWRTFNNAAPITFGSVPVVPAQVVATGQVVARALQTINGPLHQFYIPTMKVGAFAQLMQDAIRLEPNMPPTRLRAVAGNIWDSIDNRMGQLVYDNKFWNKTAKDIAHIALRAPGWDYGTIAEIGGGAADALRFKREQIGNMSQMTDKTSYTIALAVGTAMIGGIYGVLMGKPPEKLEDYYFPQNELGQRVVLPGYHKDVYNYLDDPKGTMVNKLNPLPPFLWNMSNGKQWNGAAITPQGAPWQDQIGDYAAAMAHEFQPMVWQQLEHPTAAQEGIPEYQRLLGVTPAPYDIREPDKARQFQMKDQRRAEGKLRRQGDQ